MGRRAGGRSSRDGEQKPCRARSVIPPVGAGATATGAGGGVGGATTGAGSGAGAAATGAGGSEASLIRSRLRRGAAGGSDDAASSVPLALTLSPLCGAKATGCGGSGGGGTTAGAGAGGGRTAGGGATAG